MLLSHANHDIHLEIDILHEYRILKILNPNHHHFNVITPVLPGSSTKKVKITFKNRSNFSKIVSKS